MLMSTHIQGRIDNHPAAIEVFTSCQDCLTVVVPLPAGKHSLMHVALDRAQLSEFLARTRSSVIAAEQLFVAGAEQPVIGPVPAS